MIPTRPLASRRHQNGPCLFRRCLIVIYFTRGPLRPSRARSTGRASVLCVVVRAPVATATLPSVTSRRSSPLQSAELPWNHYNSPSGFGPALRCYTPQGRTICDGRSREADMSRHQGLSIIFYFSFLFLFDSNLFQSTRSACRGITHPRAIPISLCAPLR